MLFFEDFTLEAIAVEDGKIRLRRGGDGPPLLLVHGNPQTHAMWHAVAPALAKRFTVICPDLRGYGGSMKPPATSDHAPYAKRVMAKDLVQVMEYYGFLSFQVGSHDRGARVSHRMALSIRTAWNAWRSWISYPPSNTSNAPIWPSPWGITTGSGSPSRIPSRKTSSTPRQTAGFGRTLHANPRMTAFSIQTPWPTISRMSMIQK